MYIEYRYGCTGIILKENYIRCDPANCSLRQSVNYAVVPISSVTIQYKWTLSMSCYLEKTFPKALWTQALTALTSNFGLVGLVQYAW